MILLSRLDALIRTSKFSAFHCVRVSELKKDDELKNVLCASRAGIVNMCLGWRKF